MNKNYIYIANWKMNFTINEALTFASNHYDDIAFLIKEKRKKIVLCPSAEALYPIYQMMQGIDISIGAQDCSDHLRGSCTGQISPESLQRIGCSFCIVGHSEQRALGADTNERVAHKSIMLLDCGISPIICIGENIEEHNNNKTFATLKNQLYPVFNALKTSTTNHIPIFIAYEPIWAIGTGKIATQDNVDLVLSWLYQETEKMAPGFSWKFLYGGSVKASNSTQLKQVQRLDGFLIGGASLDFEEFEKIVNYD